MTILERQMELIRKHGLDLKPADLFGPEAGQPTTHPGQQMAHRLRVHRLKPKIVREMMKVPRGQRTAAAKVLAERYGFNHNTIKTWLRQAEMGRR